MPRKAHTFDETTAINIEDIVIEKEEKPKRKAKVETPKKEDKIVEEKEDKKVKENKKEKPKTKEPDIKISEEKPKEEIPSLVDIVKNDYQEKTIIDINVPNNKIGIASDHRGYKMKQKLTYYLINKGYNVIDCGGDGIKGDDYTEFGFNLGNAIKEGKIEKGIAICGSGIGISIACNKVPKVRCAKVDNTKEVKWARKDNDANVIAISAKMPLFRAKDIVDVFLNTKFSYAERHQRRIDALNNYKG